MSVILKTTRPEGHCADDGAWIEFYDRYGDQTRADLAMGDKSDFLLANAQFMADRNSLDLVAFQTAAKDRIRWLSIQLAKCTAPKVVIPVLLECLDYFEQRQDADHDGEGFIPNEEMTLAIQVKDALVGLGWKPPPVVPFDGDSLPF